MTHNAVQADYARQAAHYDQRWSFYVQASVVATLKRSPLKPGSALLDLGCGTGTLLATALAQEPSLDCSGVDLSEAMLAIARQKLPADVSLQQANAIALAHTDASFDCVISSSAWHYFRQPEHVLSEVRRVLKPGGVFVLTDWCRDYFTCQLLDQWLRWSDPAHFHTYRRDECETLLKGAGFAIASSEAYRLNWFWGLFTLQAHLDG